MGQEGNTFTVVLSRAKRKMFFVASRSIFQLFLTDEERFANLPLWKNLLRVCREKIGEGKVACQRVQVWACGVGDVRCIGFQFRNRPMGRPESDRASGSFISHFEQSRSPPLVAVALSRRSTLRHFHVDFRIPRARS